MAVAREVLIATLSGELPEWLANNINEYVTTDKGLREWFDNCNAHGGDYNNPKYLYAAVKHAEQRKVREIAETERAMQLYNDGAAQRPFDMVPFRREDMVQVIQESREIENTSRVNLENRDNTDLATLQQELWRQIFAAYRIVRKRIELFKNV